MPGRSSVFPLVIIALARLGQFPSGINGVHQVVYVTPTSRRLSVWGGCKLKRIWSSVIPGTKDPFVAAGDHIRREGAKINYNTFSQTTNQTN